MADTSNLTNFLQDVADAIKEKREYASTKKIAAVNFDIEIAKIETGIDTSDATATAADLFSNKTAYANGEKITGTMPNNGTLNYTPRTSQQTIPSGYTSGGTISAVDSTIDNNIVVENIKKDVTILGVTGTFEGGVMTQEEYDECNELADLILGTTIVTDLDYILINPLVVDQNSDIYVDGNNLIINTGGTTNE